MRFCNIVVSATCALLIVSGTATSGIAQTNIFIEVENNQPANGFYLTPLWVGLQNGGFDFFDSGSPASNSTQILAEMGILDNGSGGGLINDFAASQPNGVQGVLFGTNGFGSGTGQPPVIDPGEIASVNLIVNNPADSQYLSFASMVIPSNDAFIGNDNPLQFEIFDALGNFNGPFTISIFGSDIWDSGTEANDGLGAAFSTNGGTSTPESLFVRPHPDGLAIFVGTGTAAGTTIGQPFGDTDLIATIRISAIPEPATASLALCGLVAVCAIRRKRQ
jgi:hypothetical protein